MNFSFTSSKWFTVLVLVLCLVVPVWFAAFGAKYQELGAYICRKHVWIPGVIGFVLTVSNSNLLILGVALLMPFVQLSILMGAARLFEYATGEPLQHVPVQWYYVKRKFKHALFDYAASVVTVLAPLYVIHLLMFGDKQG